MGGLVHMGKNKSDRFVEDWEAKRNKGKANYIFTYSIKYVVGVLAGLFIINLHRGNKINFIIFGGLCIGGIAGAIFGWNTNENKYNAIINKDEK